MDGTINNQFVHNKLLYVNLNIEYVPPDSLMAKGV
jgi:hypothetical protein